MTQLPSPQRRFPVPQHVKRVRPKTYSVAVYMVVLIVVLQIGMLISVFWLRAMVVHVNVHLPKAQGLAGTQSSNPQALIGPEKPKPGTPKPDLPNLPSLPSLSLSTPHEPRLSVPGVSDQLEQVGSLNEEAQMFLKQHAIQSALEALTKAEDIDPRHPDTLKNLAETYGLMGDAAQAKIYWQRLVDLGQGVGTIYGVAQDHIVLLGDQGNILNDQSPHPRTVYVDTVEKTPVETVNGQPQFHLRATLMRKDPLASFDQKKLQPYVIFYQQMPNGTLVPDLGQHKGSFDDTFLFWSHKTSEPFGVDYVMPIPSAQGPDSAPIGNYYGFVIGIYYDKVLQDARSEPSDLITRIPLPDEIE
jgi:hypothetical protein